jgi:hypothetical protein
MKSRVFIVVAVLFSLLFAAPGTIHHDQPNYTAFGQNGGA